MPLTSPHNPHLQRLRRAVESGRPLHNGSMAAEGPHLLEEALRSSWRVDQIFYSPGAKIRQAAILADAAKRSIELTEVGVRAFQAVSGTEQNQGILSLLRPKVFKWADLFASRRALVVLDGVQDPGNVGTIIRSTEAFGAGGIVLVEGCARVSNGKLLRASAGSIFRLPYLEGISSAEAILQVRKAELPLFALAAGAEKSLLNADLVSPFVLAVGSEGTGVCAAIREAALLLAIPTRGVESLNAAVACSISLFEAARQRESRSV